ncbi:ORF1213 [White spot syndrome virus]|uniref:ORF1213 n=1 Tax=White spot syndrome virus TaxID=342409 RepID=A0A2D3I771_9VIRU|nr:ORF1213 [White spot syndrome virus]
MCTNPSSISSLKKIKLEYCFIEWDIINVSRACLKYSWRFFFTHVLVPPSIVLHFFIYSSSL